MTKKYFFQGIFVKPITQSRTASKCFIHRHYRRVIVLRSYYAPITHLIFKINVKNA